MNPSFKSQLGQMAIAAFLIVKPGTADDTVVLATASTDPLLGTSDGLLKPSGAMVDIDLRPECEVALGGNVTRGDWLTCDATSRAITAAPGAGVNANVIGRALQSGVAGDVIRYFRAPSRIQG